MKIALNKISVISSIILLCSCADPFAFNPAPDYRIGLVKGTDGKVHAIAPECPDWAFYSNGPFQGEPWPQFGCAHARNLAAMVDRPEDLEHGREMSPALGSNAALGMRRYEQDKTKPLIDPNAKAPMADKTQGLEAEKGGAE